MYRTLSIIFLWLFTGSVAIAQSELKTQEKSIHSIMTKLNSVKDDSVKISMGLDISKFFVDKPGSVATDIDTALHFVIHHLVRGKNPGLNR
jgi:hypothetical protein